MGQVTKGKLKNECKKFISMLTNASSQTFTVHEILINKSTTFINPVQIQIDMGNYFPMITFILNCIKKEIFHHYLIFQFINTCLLRELTIFYQ